MSEFPRGGVVDATMSVAHAICPAGDYAHVTALLNTLPEPIFVKDAQHRWIVFNDAFCRFLGKTREELLGRSDYDLFPKHEADAFWAGDELVLRGDEAVEKEETLTDAAGVCHVISTRKAPFTENGERRLLGSIRNITARRRLEAQLVESERLASVGTLAAGVAHEINNPLTYVTCNVAHAVTLLETLDTPATADIVAELHACLADALEGARRVAGIVGDLRALARPQKATEHGAEHVVLDAVDVGAAVAASMRMANLVTRHRARVELAFDELPKVAAIEPRLCQVLVNVIANAAQAFVTDAPSRNVIRIEASATAEHVELTIRDNGPGIEPARLARVLEPFVTGGNGMGLGLSISDAIVRSFGGTLRVTSAVDFGTAVHIMLKRAELADVANARDQAPASEDAVVSTLPRVLVVEDEPLIRGIAKRILSATFAVTVATDAADAMRLIERTRPSFNAVLCDIRMPGKTGVELWTDVRERWPDLATHFVFMTGGIERGDIEVQLAATGNECLNKPFRPQDVRDALLRATRR